MKKNFWKITLLSCFISAFAYGAWNDLGEGETAEKTLDSGKVTTARKLILGKNSYLKLKGENTKGIEIKGGFSPEINIGEGATLDVDIENSTKDEAGLTLVSTSRNFTIQKKGNLKLKKRFNGVIDSGDIYRQFIDRKSEGALLRGISVNKKFITEGNIEIESAGTGIGFDKKTPKWKGEIEFKKGSKSFVKAGFAGVFARYNSVTFEEGSDTTLIGGAYGLMANKGIIQKGAKVTLMGNYGTGKFEVKEHDFLQFESGSELNILANDSALYGIRLKGKTKLIAKGHNVLRQIDTYADGEHSLDTVTFEKGSILDGNIDRSWNAQFLLEEGTKLFVPEKIQTNLEIKGDLFVGPRSAYEGKQKTYKEAVEDVDTVAGATALLMGKQAQKARNGEFSYRGLHSDFAADEYYTLKYNENNYKYKSTLNLNNGKIHLRLGNKDRLGRINDKIIFSKDTIIKGKGELVFHKTNSSLITKNTVFNILEEEGIKDIDGTQGYYLEKLPLTLKNVEFGALEFGRKDKKLNGRYVVTLAATGNLSQAAKNTLINSRDTYKYNQEELKSISDKIFEKHNLELKNNFWLLVSKENLKNKEENSVNLNQNSRYAGYDYTFNTGVSLGFFAGESTGKNKNIAQGIYLKKDLKPFYLGAIYKHTNSKDKKNDKKFYSNDFSFIAGYNKEIGEKVFVDSNVKLTRGYTSSYDYIAENNLNTRNKKTNYLNGEINTKLGYKFKYGNAFLKAGLDKDLKGNQKVVWDGNIDEKIKYDDFSKNVGVGMEYKLGNHSLSLELSKKYSKHYRKNTKITFGYSYKF